MRLRRLDMVGFGKFSNKSIEFEDGINIIYGENESGKTTIHNFIDGMFYGFLRPNVRSVRYLGEHELYEPWNKNKYAGIISFIYNGEGYRIEREFTRRNEGTRVFLEKTGEDITDKIDTGSRTRVLQPGYHFFGFNSNVYRNTISIKQLGIKTEEDLSKEIKEKLVNASHALDEEISVKEAIKSLENDLKDIGSHRAPTSLYGKTLAGISELKEKVNVLQTKKNEYDKLLGESQDLEKQLRGAKLSLEKIDEMLKDIEHLELQEVYNKGLELNREIQGLKIKIDELEKYRDVAEEDFNEINKKSNQLEVIESRLDYLNSSKTKVENKIDELKKSLDSSDNGGADEITLDYRDLAIMEEERDRLLNTNIKDFYNDERIVKYKKNSKMAMIGMLVAVLFLIVSLVLDLFIPMGLGSTVLLLVFAYLYLNSSKARKRELERIEYEQIRKKIEDIDSEKERILNKYEVKYLAQLRELYEKVKHKELNRQDILTNLNESKLELESIRDEINGLNEIKQANLELINKLLDKNKVKNKEDFEKALNFKREYEKNTSTLEAKELLYKSEMDEFSLEDLKSRLDAYIPKNEVDIDDKALILREKEELEEKVSSLTIKVARNDANLNNLEKDLDSMVEYEEELYEKEALIKKLNKEIEAIELAKSTIEELSKNIHEDFAPVINEKVSAIISRITKGRYTDIKVDDNLGLAVINPQSNEILEDRSLSGGTIDQLYFALRCGIISSISQEKLPLILDDCFVQYDDSRLRNVLELLSNIGEERQVVVFTCHKREKELLDELDIEYNLIKL